MAFVEATRPVVHLAAGSATACRRWSKNTTEDAAGVTCEACRKTWDFAVASRSATSAKAVRVQMEAGDGN